MAEFQTAARTRQRGSPNRLAVRIDLAPMVDLAFLLLTFFMLTTALAKPQVMPVVMPEKAQEPNDPVFQKASQVLTLLLGGNNQIFFYEGAEPIKLNATDYSATGLRQIILEKKKRVNQQWPPSEKPNLEYPGGVKQISKLTVLIKPTRESVYKNVVDVFDEMSICGVARYMLLDATDRELASIPNPVSSGR